MRANGRRPRTLNPAFAAAHGLGSGSNSNSNGNVNSSDSDRPAQRDEEAETSGNHNIEIVLKRARDTGKLLASNCSGLKTWRGANADAPGILPDEFFKFPFSESRYTEDLLTVIDFSDNEEYLGSERELDERILRYRSAQSMRFRNCGWRLPPALSFSSLENLAILDLSGNRLEGSLDLGFLLWSPSRAPALVELNLSRNGIRELRATAEGGRAATGEGEENPPLSPAATIRFPKLRTLDVSHNPPLEHLFEGDDVACENLRILRCHHNPNLEGSPRGDGPFPFLRSAASSLEVLEASHAPRLGSSCGHADLSGFAKLQTVSLSLSKLETVPRIPPSVRSLDLRSNKLASIAGMFPTEPTRAAPQLVDLILADNYLTRLDPSVIGRAVRLKRLDLSSNKLIALPYQVGFLENMSILDVSGNPVETKFPASAIRGSGSGKPQALMELLRNRAPPGAGDRTGGGPERSGNYNDNDNDNDNDPQRTSAAAAAPSGLLLAALSSKGKTTLDLTKKLVQIRGTAALEGLVGELLHPANLSLARAVTGRLLLDSNRLESLPDDLLERCLPSVQSISLADNRFAELPSSLRRCCSTAVKQLQLSKNLLTSEALARAGWFASSSSSSGSGWSLDSVTHLDLSSNRLTSFPMDVSLGKNCFPALEVLSLHGNRIDSVRDWKRLPSSLTTVDLSENNIEDAEPLSLLLSAHCPGLQGLSLADNRLRRIPASLGLLGGYAPGMASLTLRGNPQRVIRPDVLERPCPDLLEYLSNRLTAEQRGAAVERIRAHRERDDPEPEREQEREQDPPHPEPPGPPLQEPDSVEPMRDNPTSSPAEPPAAGPGKDSSSAQQSAPRQPPVSGGTPRETRESGAPPGTDETANDDDDGNDDAGNDADADADETRVLNELRESVERFKAELENLSLTQAKKYALKKSLAMERSKLIREERRLGLRR